MKIKISIFDFLYLFQNAYFILRKNLNFYLIIYIYFLFFLQNNIKNGRPFFRKKLFFLLFKKHVFTYNTLISKKNVYFREKFGKIKFFKKKFKNYLFYFFNLYKYCIYTNTSLIKHMCSYVFSIYLGGNMPSISNVLCFKKISFLFEFMWYTKLIFFFIFFYFLEQNVLFSNWLVFDDFFKKTFFFCDDRSHSASYLTPDFWTHFLLREFFRDFKNYSFFYLIFFTSLNFFYKILFFFLKEDQEFYLLVFEYIFYLNLFFFFNRTVNIILPVFYVFSIPYVFNDIMIFFWHKNLNYSSFSILFFLYTLFLKLSLSVSFIFSLKKNNSFLNILDNFNNSIAVGSSGLLVSKQFNSKINFYFKNYVKNSILITPDDIIFLKKKKTASLNRSPKIFLSLSNILASQFMVKNKIIYLLATNQGCNLDPLFLNFFVFPKPLKRVKKIRYKLKQYRVKKNIHKKNKLRRFFFKKSVFFNFFVYSVVQNTVKDSFAKLARRGGSARGIFKPLLYYKYVSFYFKSYFTVFKKELKHYEYQSTNKFLKDFKFLNPKIKWSYKFLYKLFAKNMIKVISASPSLNFPYNKNRLFKKRFKRKKRVRLKYF